MDTEGGERMSKSYQFKDLGEATTVFPDLPWQGDAGGGSFVYDAKQEQYVPVAPGQFIVSIGDRYEVHDEEPEKAKHVEAPEPEPEAEEEAPKKTAKKTNSSSNAGKSADSEAPTTVENPNAQVAE